MLKLFCCQSPYLYAYGLTQSYFKTFDTKYSRSSFLTQARLSKIYNMAIDLKRVSPSNRLQKNSFPNSCLVSSESIFKKILIKLIFGMKNLSYLETGNNLRQVFIIYKTNYWDLVWPLFGWDFYLGNSSCIYNNFAALRSLN